MDRYIYKSTIRVLKTLLSKQYIANANAYSFLNSIPVRFIKIPLEAHTCWASGVKSTRPNGLKGVSVFSLFPSLSTNLLQFHNSVRVLIVVDS